VINGKLHYFGGGYPNSGTRLDDHFVYDASNNTWTKLQDVPIPRVIHKTAVLGDSIYVISGQPDKRRVDVYNAVNDTWKQYANLPDNNFWYSGITMYQDKIYRFGGGGSIAATNASHVYNPTTDYWTAISPLPKSIHAPDAQVLGDSIYITGGYSSSRYLSGVWIYDIANDSYSQGPWLNSARSYHSMVRVGECIYTIGGNNNSNPDSTAVSLLRYCRGDDFAGNKDSQLNLNAFKLGQSETFVDVTSATISNEAVEIEITNILGVTVYTKHFLSNDIHFEKRRVLPSSGTYICYARQGNNEARMKIVHY
jgi:N-acetylneuraminic acid mutarotase